MFTRISSFNPGKKKKRKSVETSNTIYQLTFSLKMKRVYLAHPKEVSVDLNKPHHES